MESALRRTAPACRRGAFPTLDAHTRGNEADAIVGEVQLGQRGEAPARETADRHGALEVTRIRHGSNEKSGAATAGGRTEPPAE
jgi:hypothetical protein